ncbi:MAG TPA: alpha/beta hydrolase, partial [Beijerinckiaceae bacterium]
MAEHRIYSETVEGVETNIVRGGVGSPLLFLHGANGGGRWLPFMDKLAERFDVIAPEHPGFGRSGTPDWLDNVRDLAQFYHSFLRKLDLKDVTLVGTSLGGWLAAEIAVRDSSRLRALVLACAAGVRIKGVPKGNLFLWTQEELTRNLFHDPAIAERMLAMPVSDEERNIGLKNRLTTAKLAWSPRLADPDLEKWIHRIAVPTLVLWGREDKLIPVAYADRFAALIPGAQVKIFDGCGHLPHVEATDDYVAAITSFAEGT